MKLPKIILFAFCAILFLSCTSCIDEWFNTEDPEPELPPITQTGENTFGCLVNGEVMVASNSARTDAVKYSQSDNNGFYFFGNNELHNITFSIYDSLGISVSQYLIRENNEYMADADYSNESESPRTQYKPIGEDGIINITSFDIENRIISGLFNFQLASEEGDTIKITDGRFDLKF